MNQAEPKTRIDKLMRLAVILGVIGLTCVLMFLMTGFRAWSVGVGLFLGLPLLLLAMALYVVSVVRDLIEKRIL